MNLMLCAIAGLLASSVGRYLVSASLDCTIKIWDFRKKTLEAYDPFLWDCVYYVCLCAMCVLCVLFLGVGSVSVFHSH